MKSVILNKVEVLQSSVDKIGMFAKEPILNGEIVYYKGGHILSRSKFFSSSVINSYLPISDDYVIGAISLEEENEVKLYNNHSCEPNCGMRGDITFIAIKDISKGKELTIDYACVDNEDYRFKCNCGNVNCRKIITGFDWQLKSVQEKYNKEYFSSYIQSKIITGISVSIENCLNEQAKNLCREAFVDELDFKLNDEFDIDETNYIHCCLYEKNELVAYARIFVERDKVRIGRVAVRKDKRNKGYGRQVLFWAETEALKNNRTDVEVHALKSSIEFYKKLGYTVVGEEFEEEGKPHILMTKHLELN